MSTAILTQIRGRTVQAMRAATHERARGYILDIQEIIDEFRAEGSPEPAKAAIELLMEELRNAFASPDPRAVDVLIDAINCSLAEFGFAISPED